jgi:hypothetical protein
MKSRRVRKTELAPLMGEVINELYLDNLSGGTTQETYA